MDEREKQRLLALPHDEFVRELRRNVVAGFRRWSAQTQPPVDDHVHADDGEEDPQPADRPNGCGRLA